jgi:hypothetical protein
MNRGLCSRRTFLRAGGIALALPWLESLSAADGTPALTQPIPRMVFIMNNMGIMPRYFFPITAGRDYDNTPYLDLLQEHREHFTVLSGVSHPGVDGNHHSEKCFLTGAPHPAASSFRNSISVDQYAAGQIGNRTRFSSLVLRVGRTHEGTISTTADGVFVPPISSPAALYRRLFVQGSEKEIAGRIADLRRGGSLLDFVRNEASHLERGLPAVDRERLDQYTSSVRDLEVRLQHAEAWETRPKPMIDHAEPRDVAEDTEVEAQTDLMYRLMRLALQSDSSRIISLYLGPLLITPRMAGVTHQTHALTHHGNNETNIAELKLIEMMHFRVLSRLLSELRATRDASGSLLDQTMLVYGSNLSNANAHDTSNLPLIVAGGGWKHGRHLAFDRKNNEPLANLFVSMLKRMGLETERFASSTGAMTALES